MSGDHHHIHPTLRYAPAAVVVAALAANTVLAVVQVVFGLLLGSIALLADSVHQITDVVGLAIALVAIRLSAVAVSRRNTWGWGRADVLGAMFSALLLLVSSVWIAVESVRRLASPEDIDGWGVLIVAAVGLVVNAVSAMALARVQGSLATRAAVVHLVGDAAGSAGVLVAAAAVLVADATWVDPVVALAIAGWVAWSGWSLLRASSRVLADVVPAGLDVDEVLATLMEVDGVVSAHHLHVWERVPGEVSLSAHLGVEGSMAVHESRALVDQVRARLTERHAIDHATLEVECHPCGDAGHGWGPDPAKVTGEGE